MPAHMQSSLIFHYNLKFYDSDGDGFDGVSLKRFVMQVGDFVLSPYLCDVSGHKQLLQLCYIVRKINIIHSSL